MFKRLVLVLSIVVLMAGLGLPVSAQTAGGTITGVLANGTAGGSSVTNVEVRLETYVNSTLTGNSTARTQNDGSFTFNNLVTAPQNTYRVALTYQEADYGGDNITFGTGENSRSENITVYDSTDNADVVSVDAYHTIITPVQGFLQIMVVCEFTNNTDRAFIGTGDPMANGKKKTLTFTLPADTSGIKYVEGLGENYVYPSHEGFIDTRAVFPGGREVVYQYQVPYNGGSYNFLQKLDYATASFNLFVQGDKIKVKSDQLVEQAPVDLGMGATYVYLIGQNFTAGQTVSATISGADAISQKLIIILCAVVLLLVLGGGLAYWRMRKGRNPLPVANAVGGEGDEHNLLIELARLDDDFAAGLITENAYRTRRASKKARLVKLMSGKRG